LRHQGVARVIKFVMKMHKSLWLGEPFEICPKVKA